MQRPGFRGSRVENGHEGYHAHGLGLKLPEIRTSDHLIAPPVKYGICIIDSWSDHLIIWSSDNNPLQEYLSYRVPQGRSDCLADIYWWVGVWIQIWVSTDMNWDGEKAYECTEMRHPEIFADHPHPPSEVTRCKNAVKMRRQHVRRQCYTPIHL